ncbi:MAG: tRNA (adenosine(37)-N6)-dimethylallyltransferase MiaA [Phycisphaerales bacterium]
MRGKIPIIAGPTAGGKTALAVEVARCLAPAQVVSADSMLLYRGMNIGTAKPTEAERGGVPHHLIDICDPADSFTVHDWLRAAAGAIGSIMSSGAHPVVAGGTHLYIKALLDGLFEGPGADPTIRVELDALDNDALRELLLDADPATAARLHPNDRRRTIRALEVFRLTGTPISALQKQWDTDRPESPYLLVVLTWPTELINRRINDRVRQMIAQGLVEEARGLWEARRLGPQAREALGYKQLVAHFEGRCSLDDAIEQIKIETRRFAKNQRTWLRRLGAAPGCVRIDCEVVPPHGRADLVLSALGVSA